MAADQHQEQAQHTRAVVTVVVAPGQLQEQAQEALVTGHVRNRVYHARNVVLPATGQVLDQVLQRGVTKVALAIAPLHEHPPHARAAVFQV